MTTARRARARLLTALAVSATTALTAVQLPASATTYGQHDVRGSIELVYLDKGGPSGVLGLPLTDETPTADGSGRYNRFEGGAVYWSPLSLGEVHGAIFQRWAELSPGQPTLERSVLGYPVTNEDPTPDGVGRVNHFQGGKIYWTPTTGAHEVYGAILQTWVSLGYETSPLGYPTSGEYAVPGGRRSDFQGGSITFTPRGGSVVTFTVPVDPDVVTGAGSQVVPLRKPRGPALLRSSTTGTAGSRFSVIGYVNGAASEVLAEGVTPYDGVAPLDFRYVRENLPVTTEVAVESDTTWRLELVPLAATGTFGKRQTIGESRSTVWRYTGRSGTARLTHTTGVGRFAVYAYDADTTDPEVLTRGEGPVDVYVPVEADQYLEIVSDGSWAITVV